MNFQHRDFWTLHFIEADCRTLIGSKTRYYSLGTVEGVRSFVSRCTPDPGGIEQFDQMVRSWARGSLYVNLTDEQYARLKR